MKTLLVCAVFISALAIMFLANAISPNKPAVSYSYGPGRGYWATLNAPNGAHWNMHRGPYWYEWQARNAFPIQRWTWKGGGQ